LKANNGNPLPQIIRTSKDTEAILAPQASQVAFKLTLVTDSGEVPVVSTNNKPVLEVADMRAQPAQPGKYPLAGFGFANNHLLTPADFCDVVWPQVTNFLGSSIIKYCSSNVLPAKMDLKLATYLRLDNGSLVQTDDPLVISLKTR
jgi:hypothetical protein